MYLNTKAIADDTLQIIKQGYYQYQQQQINITQTLQSAINNTIEYPANHNFNINLTPKYKTIFSVKNETTLACAQRLATTSNIVPFVLNFASAKNPGGGFLRGAVAQEETLARSSGLYATLLQPSQEPKQFYLKHRENKNPLYSHASIYSPQVPVFKLDNGQSCLPYLATFLTIAAVNYSIMDEDITTLSTVMRERIDRVLTIAAHHQHSHLVLGAWGCGIFGNPPELIASLFKQALTTKFEGVFQEVNFAILDNPKSKLVISPFEALF